MNDTLNRNEESQAQGSAVAPQNQLTPPTGGKGQAKEGYDGSTPPRFNVAAITTLAGAEKALDRITTRQAWIKERRVMLRDTLQASTDDAKRLSAYDEGVSLKAEKADLEEGKQDLEAKKQAIAAKRVGEIDESIFDDLA